MLGLTQLFGAIKRLAGEINTMADLFGTANGELRQRLAVAGEVDEAPAGVTYKPAKKEVRR